MRTAKDINFVPDYVFEKQLKAKKQAVTMFWAAICVVFVLGLFSAPKIAYKYYDMYVKKLDAQLLQLSDVREKVNLLSRVTADKEMKKNVLSNIDKDQIMITKLVSRIENVLPNNIEMKSYSLTQDMFNVSFKVYTPLEIIELMNRLESLNLFEKVDISSLPIVDTDYIVSFSLKFKENAGVEL